MTASNPALPVPTTHDTPAPLTPLVARRTVLASLLQRFWLETQGQDAVSIDSLNVEAL